MLDSIHRKFDVTIYRKFRRYDIQHSYRFDGRYNIYSILSDRGLTHHDMISRNDMGRDVAGRMLVDSAMGSGLEVDIGSVALDKGREPRRLLTGWVLGAPLGLSTDSKGHTIYGGP